MTPTRRGSPGVTAAALAAVYFIWGSTYLGLRFGLRGFDPFVLNGLRFVIAGGAMFGVLRWRRVASPTARQWRNLALLAGLMLVGGVGLVTIAEDLGVGSGVAATAVAVMPLWAALAAGWFGEWPSRREWVGLFIGFIGVGLLAREGDLQATMTGLVLVIVAPMSWALGSVWAGRLDLPGPMQATAGQLLVGGGMLLGLAPLRGESFRPSADLAAWSALLYLTIFGSIVAYTAYVYLLRTVRPVLATSYAYVNPVVAVILGVTVGAEVLTGPMFFALPLILLGVALVTAPRRRTDRRSWQVSGGRQRLRRAA